MSSNVALLINLKNWKNFSTSHTSVGSKGFSEDRWVGENVATDHEMSGLLFVLS